MRERKKLEGKSLTCEKFDVLCPRIDESEMRPASEEEIEKQQQQRNNKSLSRDNEVQKGSNYCKRNSTSRNWV